MRYLPGFVNPESDAGNNAAAKVIGDLWCKFMHSSIMWPVRGYYACATCGRLYPVPWANLQGVALGGQGVALAGTAPMSGKTIDQQASTIRLEAKSSMHPSRSM